MKTIQVTDLEHSLLETAVIEYRNTLKQDANTVPVSLRDAVAVIIDAADALYEKVIDPIEIDDDAGLVTHADADGGVYYLDVRVVDAEASELDMRLQVNESGDHFSLFVKTDEDETSTEDAVAPDPEITRVLLNALARALKEKSTFDIHIYREASNAYSRGEFSPLLDAVIFQARTYGDTD